MTLVPTGLDFGAVGLADPAVKAALGTSVDACRINLLPLGMMFKVGVNNGFPFLRNSHPYKRKIVEKQDKMVEG